MTNRKFPIGLLMVILALLVATGCSKDDEAAPEEKTAAAVPTPPLPELDPLELLDRLAIGKGDGQAVELRYQPAESSSYDVKLYQKSSQLRAGKDLSIGTRQTFVLVRKLLEQSEDSWQVELSLNNLKVQPDAQAKDKELSAAMTAAAEALEKVRFQITTNGLGAVQEFAVSGGESSRWKGMTDALEHLVRDSAVTLPKQAVKPGDSWDASRQVLLRKQKTANKIDYKLTSTFLGYAEYEGRCKHCAVVRTTGTFTIEGKITAPGMKGETAGHGKADALAVIDVERGLLAASALAAASVQDFNLKPDYEVRKAGDKQARDVHMQFAEVMESSFQQELQMPGKHAGEKPNQAESK